MEEQDWYDGILTFMIIPLLEEYFYDRPEIVEELIEEILIHSEIMQVKKKPY